MRRRITYTIYPPRLRKWIGDAILRLAVRIAKASYTDRSHVVQLVGLAYDLISRRQKYNDLFTKLRNPTPWGIIRLAVKVLMIRNISREAIIRQSCQEYNKLEETAHGEKT